MKSAVFYGKHDIRIEDFLKPEIRQHEVLIQVMACGVCGTDVHIYEGDPGAASVTTPSILGHEFAGVIVEVGKQVHQWKLGDRVCVDPNHPCGHCDSCRGGEAHFCEHMVGYGTSVHGGFAQYCAVHENQLYALADHVTYAQGAMSEPVACCMHGIDMCEIKPGQNVVVIGAGMIGQLMIQLAKLSGATNIACIETISEKRNIAKQMGANQCIDPINENVKEKLASFGNINCVIECVGRTSTIEQAIDIAGYRGIVMMFGLTSPDASFPLYPFTIFQKELVLKSSYINPYTQKRALDIIASLQLDVTSMVYDCVALSKLPEILKNSELRSKGKYIILPQEGLV